MSKELTRLGNIKAFAIVWGCGLFFRMGDVGKVSCRGFVVRPKFALYVDVSKGSFEGYL